MARSGRTSHAPLPVGTSSSIPRGDHATRDRPAGRRALGPEAAAIAGPEFDAPSGLAYGGGHLWVANQANNSVTEVNPSTGAWIKTIRKSADGFDQPAAIIDVGADLFVVNGGGSVTELLAQNGSLVGHVSGPAFGFDNPVAVAAIGSRLYVLNAGQPTASPAVPGSVTIIDAGTRSLLGTISGPAFSSMIRRR